MQINTIIIEMTFLFHTDWKSTAYIQDNLLLRNKSSATSSLGGKKNDLQSLTSLFTHLVSN